MKKLYNSIKVKYWNDPVWSKVISAGIITVLGTIITTIYLFIQSILDKISFTESFDILVLFFSKTTPINNLIILLTALIFLFLFLSMFTKSSLRKSSEIQESKIANDTIQELPSVGVASTVFFADRIAGAFPGERNIIVFNNPKTIVERLDILFEEPLKFKSSNIDQHSSTPIWWFRGHSNMYITSFKKLSKTKILLDSHELQIKKMIVNKDASYYKCFIYLECYGESQTGLYGITESEMQSHLNTFGYSWEEYALFQNTPIKRAEYDDGAAIINSKVVKIDKAEPRVRYLTGYNLLIAAHDSPYNSEKFDRNSEKYFNDILERKTNQQPLIDFLNSFGKNEK